MQSWKTISSNQYNFPQSSKLNNLNCNELIANNVNINDNLDVNGNARIRYNLDVSGNVGIGTSTPSTSLAVNGDISANGLILYSSTSPYESGKVDQSNRTNTYVTFTQAGSINDWAYLRQTGGDNSFNLALDLHDDGTGGTPPFSGGFNIRSVKSTNVPDTINTLFSVRQQDNGRVGIATDTPTQALDVSGNAIIRGNLDVSRDFIYKNQIMPRYIIGTGTFTPTVGTNQLYPTPVVITPTITLTPSTVAVVSICNGDIVANNSIVFIGAALSFNGLSPTTQVNELRFWYTSNSVITARFNYDIRYY